MTEPSDARNVVAFDPARFASAIQEPADSSDEIGVNVRELQTGTPLSIYTRNSHYRLTVLNGETGMVVLQGGRHFPQPTYARVRASSSEAVPSGWIGPGQRLEISEGDKQVLTSTVQDVRVEEAAWAERAFWRIA